MKFRVHLVHETTPQLQQRFDWLYSQTERLHQQIAQVLSNQEFIMATIKELVDSVAAVKGEADSVGALITQLREQITGLTSGNLPPDVQAQVDQAFADAEASKTELAAAIKAPGTAPASLSPSGPTASTP